MHEVTCAATAERTDAWGLELCSDARTKRSQAPAVLLVPACVVAVRASEQSSRPHAQPGASGPAGASMCGCTARNVWQEQARDMQDATDCSARASAVNQSCRPAMQRPQHSHWGLASLS